MTIDCFGPVPLPGATVLDITAPQLNGVALTSDATRPVTTDLRCLPSSWACPTPTNSARRRLSQWKRGLRLRLPVRVWRATERWPSWLAPRVLWTTLTVDAPDAPATAAISYAAGTSAAAGARLRVSSSAAQPAAGLLTAAAWRRRGRRQRRSGARGGCLCRPVQRRGPGHAELCRRPYRPGADHGAGPTRNSAAGQLAKSDRSAGSAGSRGEDEALRFRSFSVLSCPARWRRSDRERPAVSTRTRAGAAALLNSQAVAKHRNLPGPSVDLTATSASAGATSTRAVHIGFRMLGPGDVTGLNAAQVIRT